ncbi:AbfB domain-containing protein [Streptomyces spinoverrucosus]|uniref:AbfB domain-containing protein n=1 Tax=Streptomyces spinoverrucosus TaxID=284043 RepID=UPI0018C3F95C|nr:AbfB domain-containing protein [Streptomyces spinoverrucosus]MBG0856238.1 AbfB domain-containing protein [Streptomyces spinoverrucosus]
MPESSTPPPQQPWENNWSPDTSRVPGTRRLWLAGALAMATIVAGVTAVAVMETQSDDMSPKSAPPAPTDGATVPGLISFASPSSAGTTTPPGKSALSSAHPSRTSSGKPSPAPASTPPKSPAPGATSSNSPKPPSTSATWRFVNSVNYPDRYWRVSDGRVVLDTVTSSSDREDARLRLVKGLADSSCYSFVTADGDYLRHHEFVLRAEGHDGSGLFRQDATFCPRSLGYSDAIALESVNYPGHFLRHQDFRLRLDSYQHNGQYYADMAFRLVTDVTETQHGYGDGYGYGYGYDSGPRRNTGGH